MRPLTVAGSVMRHVGGGLADLRLSRLIGVRLNHADGFLLGEFRQLADAEDQRIRQPLRRRHPQLTLAGRRAGSDGDLERDGFGQDGTGEPAWH